MVERIEMRRRVGIDKIVNAWIAWNIVNFGKSDFHWRNKSRPMIIRIT